MPGKIKQAVKKAKNKRYKKQLAKGEKKGTNVYMGRGIGTVTAKTAKKNQKAMSGATQLSKQKQKKAMESGKNTSKVSTAAVMEALRSMSPTSAAAKKAMTAIKKPTNSPRKTTAINDKPMPRAKKTKMAKKK